MVRERDNERSISETLLIYSAGASIMAGKAKPLDEAIKKVRNGG